MPSPIDITPEQLAALEADRLGDFCARVRAHLAAHPATYVAHRLPLSWFEQRVTQASTYGITIEADVATYLEIILRAGDDIVDHPEVAAILSRPDLPQGDKVRQAEARVRHIVNR